MIKPFDTPVQIAYVVADAEVAALNFSRITGAGPFFLRQHIPVTDVVYCGTPAIFDHTSAYGQWGQVMVEFVQDHTVGPSILKETALTAASQGPRIHHVACLVDDFAATLTTARDDGIVIAMTAQSRSIPFAFLDTVSALGHFIEIYPRTASITAFYQQVADAALGWDGADEVRLME